MSVATRTCSKCNETKPVAGGFPSNGTKVCLACRDAQRSRTIEKKDAVAYTDALAERIVDLLAAGSTIAEVTAQASMPTPRQLRAWRRANVDFDAACEAAMQASAAAHIDAAKQVLKDIESGKGKADAKTLFDGHMKLAATLHPKRYGSNPTIDITSAGKPIVDLTAVLEAAFAALPALPKPIDIDVEAEEVPPDRTLQ